MRVDRTRGTLVIRLGKRFAAAEVERISEAVLATAPLSALTLNFADVDEFDFSAIFPLIGVLEALQDVKVVFLGLTLHQRRMLKYFGVRHGEPESGSGTAQRRTSAAEPAVGCVAAEAGVLPEEVGGPEPAPMDLQRRRPPSELKAILESMTTGVVTYDMSGRLVSRNKAARLLIPLTSTERDRLERERVPLLVVKGCWLDGSPIRAEETGVARALQGEESEALVIRIEGDEPDARPNVFSVRTAPLLDEAGAVVGAVTALTDITQAHGLHEQHDRGQVASSGSCCSPALNRVKFGQASGASRAVYGHRWCERLARWSGGRHEGRMGLLSLDHGRSAVGGPCGEATGTLPGRLQNTFPGRFRETPPSVVPDL